MALEPTPPSTLEIPTARLCLSPLTEADQAAVFAYARDPRVAATVTWEPHASPADSLEFIRFTIGNTRTTPGKFFLAFAIRDLATKQAIGTITFSQYSFIGGQIDYALGAEHWNKGLTTEAAHAVLAWAFMALPELVRIQARCLPENQSSRRVMEKVGMRFEGIGRSALLVKGKAVDLTTYAILRSDLVDGETRSRQLPP